MAAFKECFKTLKTFDFPLGLCNHSCSCQGLVSDEISWTLKPAFFYWVSLVKVYCTKESTNLPFSAAAHGQTIQDICCSKISPVTQRVDCGKFET